MAVAEDAGLTELKAGALDTLLESTDLGIAVFDHELRYRHINQTLAGFNGMSAEDHLGKTVWDVLPSLAPAIVPELTAVLETGIGLPDLKFNPGEENGQDYWEASYLPIKDEEGQTIGVLATATNRTMEYALEQARRESHDLVRRIIDSLFTFVGILTPDGTVVDANRSPLEAAGITLDDVVGKKYWDCFWWNYSPAVQRQLREAVLQASEGETVRYDVVVRTIGDTRITIDFMLSPLRDSNGRITYLIPSANDITERIDRESELRFSEERFRRVFEATADGLLMIDESGAITLVNSRAAEMFGYEQNEMYDLKVEDLVPESHRERHRHDRTRYQNMPQPRAMAAMRELFAERRDGSRFPVEVGLTPLEFPEGTRILATIMDVSIQKDIQKSLVDALLEKTSLLNEVHHRVKNNLQVVSSLLNLQSRGVPEDVRKHFDESQGRVKAMALIHQQLYEQKSYEQIEAVSYLKNLCDLMRRSYTGATSHISIDIHSDNGQVYLMMDQALPFGLLVNELVTNAIKHAFIGRESGTIEISLIQDEKMTEVMVRDDGIGLPENVELSTTRSLGFQLIPGLAEQLEAELTLIRSEGTRFEFRFATQAGRK